MGLLDEIVFRCGKHLRFLLFCTLLPTLLAGMLSLLLPKYYLAQTSVLPVNSRLSDKARFAGEEIAELYSAFGNGDDLDRIFAAAQSADVYRKLTDSFRLVDHYRLQAKGKAAPELAAKTLRKRSEIRKSEYGEMQVRVWDRDPQIAASMANAIVSEVERMHHELYRTFYAGSLASLQRERAVQAVSADSMSASMDERYQKNIADFSMAMNHPPPAVMVIEEAMPAVKADRPKFWLNLTATFLVSFFTAIAAILLFTKPLTAER
jgi:capsular polysaccharide biosynthesis protein